jgi:hypothetical protein
VSQDMEAQLAPWAKWTIDLSQASRPEEARSFGPAFFVSRGI